MREDSGAGSGGIGGQVRSAYGGALAMRHLVAATRREFQKLGKVVEASHFAGFTGLA